VLVAVLVGGGGLLLALVATGILGGGGVAASATLSDAQIVDRFVPMERYCERRPDATDCSAATRNELTTPGHVVAVTVEASGYGGKALPLKWSTYDAVTRRRLTAPAPGWPDAGYVPDADRDSDRNQLELWVPVPADPGEYYVLLELYPDAGSRLATAETDPFVVTEGTRVAI
jgi:hypothetical protein